MFTIEPCLAGAECDLLLVYRPNRLPSATIEVKKPSNSKEGRKLIYEGIDDEGNRVAGEVHDEMTAVRLFGFRMVTGMIATGNQFRIVGLHADDNSDPELPAAKNTRMATTRSETKGKTAKMQSNVDTLL